MKKEILIVWLSLILASCQVQERSANDEVVSNHKSSPNAFTFIPPEFKNYFTGDILTISMSFPTQVWVDTTLGVPRLVVEIEGRSVDVLYVSGHGTNTLHFEYVIESGDVDEDGIQIIYLALSGSNLSYIGGSVFKKCNTAFVPFSLSQVLINSW